MDPNKYCSISQAIIWMVNKTDPVGEQTAAKLEFRPIIDSLNLGQITDAINGIVISFERGEINIFADIVVMKWFGGDSFMVDIARDATTGMEFEELDESYLRYYEAPRVYRKLGEKQKLPIGSIHTRSVFVNYNEIKLPDEIDGFSLPEPELNEGATRSYFNYYLLAKNCRISIRDLATSFPKSRPPNEKSRTGRPVQFEWDEAWVSVFREIFVEGFPNTQAEIERLFENHFFHKDQEPGDTSIRLKAKVLFSRRDEFSNLS